MRKKTENRLKGCVLALAVAAVAAGVPAASAHAEELATDTDAVTAGVTEEAQADLPGEEVSTDEVTVEASEAPYYNITVNGGAFDGTYYRLGGQVIASAFFCDGTYTYYLQADGTPMKDMLTYHPDGEHVIYFDANGHEVFSDFAHVTKSIAGDAVDDLCFFDVYGYMYVNKLTYDQAGVNLYYVNQYGVIERNGWFQFPINIRGLANYNWTMYDVMESDGFYGLYGYGNSDGTLMTSTWTYNWNGQAVYLQGNGSTAKGLHNIGGEWCLFDANDAHLVQKTSERPSYATLTCYHSSNYYEVVTYSGNEKTVDIWDGRTSRTVYTYDEYGRLIQKNMEFQISTDSTDVGVMNVTWQYYGTSDKISSSWSYIRGLEYDFPLITEVYYNNDDDNCASGYMSDGTLWEAQTAL